jgi:predicted ester cyclase
LPYARVSKRQVRVRAQHVPPDSLQIAMINDVAPERLTAAKRIINAYNAGDIEGIKTIIYDSTIPMCEVYFSSLSHVFVGKAALYSLWVSLFEAFPNGVFRTSDSVIDEHKQVHTRFLFTGTKIFPLLIDGTPVEGMADSIVVQSSSVVADHSRPMYNTAELLETDDIPDMVFEGRIIVQMNEQCQIKKFDFSWSKKP